MTPQLYPLISHRNWRVIQLALLLAVVVAAVFVIPLVKSLVVVLVVSLVFTYLAKPVMFHLERMGLPRDAAITTLFVVAAGVCVGAVAIVLPIFFREAGALFAKLGQIDLKTIHSGLVDRLERIMPGMSGMLNLEAGQLEGWKEKVAAGLSGHLKDSFALLGHAADILVMLTLIPFLVYFFLRDSDRFTRQLIEKVPNRFFEMTLSLVYSIDRQLGNYIRSLLIESVIIGILTWLALAVLGVKFALILGILNALFNLIPFIGPILAYFPVGAVVVMTYTPVGLGLIWMVVILLGVQLLDETILKPVVISRSVQIHPVVVLVAVMIGGGIGGAFGMFIAVPVYSILQVIVVDFHHHLKRYRVI
jgi:predicted PurR-regulated permease PerM